MATNRSYDRLGPRTKDLLDSIHLSQTAGVAFEDFTPIPPTQLADFDDLSTRTWDGYTTIRDQMMQMVGDRGYYAVGVMGTWTIRVGANSIQMWREEDIGNLYRMQGFGPVFEGGNTCSMTPRKARHWVALMLADLGTQEK